MTIAEAAGRAGLARGTAFLLVHSLVSLGHLRPVPGSRRFRLGLKCLELGFLALARWDSRAHAAPLLRERVPAVADAGSLVTLDGPDVVHLVRVGAGPGRHDASRRPGRRTPARDSALGLAQLAFLPEARQIAALEGAERTESSGRTPDRPRRPARTPASGARSESRRLGQGERLRPVDGRGLGSGRRRRPDRGVSFAGDAGRLTLGEFVALAGPEVLHVAERLTDAVRHSAGTTVFGGIAERKSPPTPLDEKLIRRYRVV